MEAVLTAPEARHAVLGASSAFRWLNCLPSALREAEKEDRDTSFTREGTAAHWIAASHAAEATGVRRDPDPEGDAEAGAILDETAEYDREEMERHGRDYGEFVAERYVAAEQRSSDAVALLERRVDFSGIVPGGFGTADCLIIADGVMEVIDYKYGKGVRVCAVDNPQMALYALGSLSAYGWDYDIRKVVMTIYQPRLGHVDTWEQTAEELWRWAGEECQPKALLAAQGKGAYSCGEWCRFCKIRSECGHYATQMAGVAALHIKGPEIGLDVLGKDVLPVAASMKAWIAGVEERALKAALDGEEVPGWKVVEGKGRRVITDPEAARKALEGAGYTDILKPAELLPMTTLEKMAGRKRFGELCGAWIERKPGKPTLAPDGDTRDPFDVSGDFEEFE